MGSDELQPLCPPGSGLLGVLTNISYGDKVPAPGEQSCQCPSRALHGPQIPQWNGSNPTVLVTHIPTLLRLLIIAHQTISGETSLLIISKLLFQINSGKPYVQDAKL